MDFKPWCLDRIRQSFVTGSGLIWKKQDLDSDPNSLKKRIRNPVCNPHLLIILKELTTILCSRLVQEEYKEFL